MRPEENYGFVLAYINNEYWLLPRDRRCFTPGEIANALGTCKADTTSYAPNGECYEVFEARGDIYREEYVRDTTPEETNVLRELVSSLIKKSKFMKSKINFKELEPREKELFKKLY